MVDKDVEVATPEAPSTQRRVYALPTEMVERIVEFQREKGFQSEVEAVRRLLDEALKSRDTPEKIINRFLNRLEVYRVASEAARDVLFGHPLVEGIRFGKDSVVATIIGSPDVTLHDNGMVQFASAGFGDEQWKWVRNKTNKYGPGSIDDGSIPF